jgi:hypothetical protein
MNVLIAILCLAAVADPSTVTTVPRPSARQFVAGLTERRLFDLAALECRNQLSRSDISARALADWTVELQRTLTLNAIHTGPTERAEKWQAAHAVAEEFLAQQDTNPRRVLVQLQDALTSLAEGELARFEAEVAAEPTAALDKARTSIRQASRAFEELDKQLTGIIANAPDRPTESGELSGNELLAVQNNVRFQLARTLSNQALCYPTGSDDRIASLTLATEQLQRVLRQLRDDDPLAWQVYLHLATCYRLLGNTEQAEQALTAPASDKAPEDIRALAAAEQAELKISAGQPQQALDMLEQPPASAQPSSLNGEAESRQAAAQRAFVQLKAMLALWQSTVEQRDETGSANWEKRATAQVGLLERQFGPYWGRRGELALLHSIGGGLPAQNNDNILGRTADNLYLKEQYEEAIQTYDRAAQQARDKSDLAGAFTWAYKAALVEQKLLRHDRAAQRLQQLASTQVEHPQAAAAHLLAAWNLAQVVRGDPAAAERYAALLAEHLQLWPDTETSLQAAAWLGKLRESQGQWEQAVAAYRDLRTDSDEFTASFPALVQCWDKWLEAQRAAGQNVEDAATSAAQYYDALILGPDRQWPTTWTPLQRTAALAAARVRLSFMNNASADAERALKAAWLSADQADEAWRNEAQSLLVVAVAGQPGRAMEARQLLDALGGESPDRMLDVVHGLSALSEHAGQDLREPLAKLQLAALDHLQQSSATLQESQRIRLEQVRAEALRAAGRLKESLEVYQQLAAARPDDGRVQMDFGQLLLESDEPTARDQAVTQWQKIMRRVRPASDEWFRAKYSFALALYQRNRGQDRATAGQQLRYLQATSSVNETNWKTQVDALLEKCPK